MTLFAHKSLKLKKKKYGFFRNGFAAIVPRYGLSLNAILSFIS